MKSGRRFLLGGVAALACGIAMAGADVRAQVKGAVGQPGTRPERPDARSDAARAADAELDRQIFELFAS